MNYSSKKFAIFIATVPLLLTGLIILLHKSQTHTRLDTILDVALIGVGIFLSVLFYLYLQHLSQTTEQMLKAIQEFEISGDIDGLPVERDDELGRLGRAIVSIFRREEHHIKDLQAGKAKLMALFEVVNEGIVIADAAGKIQDVNPSLCSMLGYNNAEELTGKSVNVLMPAPYSVHHDQYMHNALDSGSMGFMGMYRDLRALRKDGSSFEVELSVDLMNVAGENYFAATLRDVSEQRQHEKQLMNAKIKAEVANEAKSNFLSMMSHEIRTPLNGVMGTLELLGDETNRQQQKDLLKVANKSARNLLHIVNDILDMSRVESGKMELEQTSFDLSHILQETVELYTGKAVEKGLSLTFEMPAQPPFRLLADTHRLRQMLNNLLGNAIKFTHRGKITLSAQWHELDADTVEVSITISDTGIGVSAEKQEIIFEPFVQEDNTISREYGGTGLGLSIVKHLAEKMGGTIHLQSVRGEGSRFSLTIPMQKSTAIDNIAENWLQGRVVDCIEVGDELLLNYLRSHGAEIRQHAQAEFFSQLETQEPQADLLVLGNSDTSMVTIANQCSRSATVAQHIVLICDAAASWETEPDAAILLARRPLLPVSLDSLFQYLYDSGNKTKNRLMPQGSEMKKILLVEDNPVNQMVAQAMLEKMGYEVVVAANGQLGVEVMKTQPIDLVLMDLHMPVMDGYEATSRIRELKGPGVPILAMTADAGIADKDNCLAAGMNDHLPKPIKMETLQQAMEHWLAS